MSPEQSGPAREEIDRRTDIYSLGVLLHELLVGCVPFDFDGFGLYEQLRIIHEREPDAPSAKYKSLPEKKALIIAQTRKTNPSQLVGSVHGKLDGIVMRCLEKKRQDRYDTAMALAVDIENWLAAQAHAAEGAPPKRSVGPLPLIDLALLVGLLFVVVATMFGIVLLLSRNQQRALDEDDVMTPNSLMTLTINTLRNEPRALTEGDVETADSLMYRMIQNLKSK